MKKTKNNYVLIVLVVILLALAVGYASFSTGLNINGTATGTGTWEVKFLEPSMSDSTHGTATLTNDTTITVAATLAFPGDGCTVTANIKNTGTVPAKLTDFKLTMDDGKTPYSNENISVILPEIADDGSEIIAAGETCPVTFAIKWNTNSTTTDPVSKFQIHFEYEQSTNEVTVTPTHGTHK